MISTLFAAGIIQVAGASCIAKMGSSILRVALLLAGASVIDGERAIVFGTVHGARVLVTA